MRTLKHLLVSLASAGLLAACGGGGTETTADAAPQDRSLAEAASGEASASEFMKLAQSSGAAQRLQADDDLTLIAPSNDAMAEMAEEIAELRKPENREELRQFVESHLVPKRMESGDMQTGTETTVAGSDGITRLSFGTGTCLPV